MFFRTSERLLKKFINFYELKMGNIDLDGNREIGIRVTSSEWSKKLYRAKSLLKIVEKKSLSD